MVNLTDCDREPIHVPGTIQPFGVLLVLAEPSLIVTQISENIGDHLPVAVGGVLGQPLANVLDPASVAAVSESLREERWQDLNPLHVGAHGKEFDGIVHRHEGAAILELEPNPGPPLAMAHPFRAALIRLQRVSTCAELGQVVVEQMRRVTGFERILFYRFHQDDHGSVEAEAKEPGLEAYLGLHYPASDIPAQARALYRRNWLRLVFDRSARPARVVPTLRPDTGGSLDLSFSVLRSVSPIHLEYMANMGVHASMSISLIVRDRLWGLISCLNHTSPRRVSHETRMACEFLGRLASLQIGAFEDQEQLAHRASRRAIQDDLTRAMRESAPDGNVLEVLLTRPKDLMEIVSAEGVAVVSGGEVTARGRTPPPALIQNIAAWVQEKEAFRPFATASLGIAFPPARDASGVASGLLTFALPGATERRLLWFRPELIDTVRWGGDPSKPVAAPPGDRLRPRQSFAQWREEVRLRSSPWTASNLEAADELQRCAIEVDLERRFSSEQRAVRTRDDLLAVVSHDLQNPLASILLEAKSILRLTAADDEEEPVPVLRQCAEGIEESTTRLIGLTNELLDLASIEGNGVQLDLQLVESRKLVEDALRSATPLAEAKRITLAGEFIDSPRLEADPDRVLRVLSNLLGNAIKFTPDRGTINVRAERRGDDVSIRVDDTGPGIAADHLPHVFERYWKGTSTTASGSGLGLYIARRIVEAHGGTIRAESSAAGARFTFTLPLTR